MKTMPYIGTLEITSKYRYGLTSRGTPLYLFKPYDTDLPEFIVGSNIRDHSRDRIALVETSETLGDRVRPRANLIRLIGPVGDFEAEKKGLLLHYGSPAAFKKVVNDPVDESQDGKRIEISSETGWYTYHVDPLGCRDIDDAIAYNRVSGETAITIADAAAFVTAGSELDKAACAIGATFYDLNGKVMLPMLPTTVSEDSASLCPGQRRRGVSLIIDRDGKETFVLSWITVQHSFTYESFEDEVNEQAALTNVLTGSDPGTFDPHKIIETLMIRYNTAVARKLVELKAGLLRVQAVADATLVSHWTAIDPRLSTLANEAATYSLPTEDENQVHASIGSVYCHASSPLRRYADLVNQRVIKAAMLDRTVALDDAIDLHLNHRTKANRRWARDLTFLTKVTPGRIHHIDVLWISEDQVWVPAWKRIIRTSHERPVTVGSDSIGIRAIEDKIAIFCDPSKRNWKARVLTAAL